MAAVKKKVEVPGKRAAGKAGAAGELVGKKPASKEASKATGRKASSRGTRTLACRSSTVASSVCDSTLRISRVVRLAAAILVGGDG